MPESLPDGLFFDLVSADEILNAYEIERAGFPEDEAATLEKFQYRQANAPSLFLGAYLPPRTLIGYTCSTLAASTSLTHESMSTHDPKGSSVCVHGVIVKAEYQHRGIALQMLKEYLRRVEQEPGVERVLLICHDDLRALYEKAGFEWAGKSNVVHGTRDWYEMRKVFNGPIQQPQIPAGVWEALSSRQNRQRPDVRLFSSFESPDDFIGADGTNKLDIFCPRPGCGSKILLKGASKSVQAPSIELDPPTHPSSELLTALPQPPTATYWWLVSPSPMQFENIGFSKPVPPVESGGKRQKLLACAECDLGPLGWSEEGGREFWVAAVRVGYREGNV